MQKTIKQFEQDNLDLLQANNKLMEDLNELKELYGKLQVKFDKNYNKFLLDVINSKEGTLLKALKALVFYSDFENYNSVDGEKSKVNKDLGNKARKVIKDIRDGL
ncbi:hypothetical protein ACFVRU_40175 [Streptomyces sp. NPDC057927]